MRDIKFKGKSNTGVWVYGSLVCSENIHPAIYFETGKGNIKSLEWVYVYPETVGQFTGLTDKNGKEIYEGDIIEDKNGIGVIMWFQTAWGVASYAHVYNGLKSYTAVDSFYSKETKEWAVIGSIHDNPELLTK